MKTPVATSLAMAARTLRQGGIVVYPTETFYAIGCRADIPDAVGTIFRLKGRGFNRPLPLLAGSLQQVAMVVDISGMDPELPGVFWPGALTMLLPGKERLARLLVNRSGEAAIRVSGYEPARRLANLAGFPITCSSANFSGRPPANACGRLDPEFLAEVAKLEAGCSLLACDNPCADNMPSTICRQLSGRQVRTLLILRRGALPRTALEAAGFACIDAG